MCLYVSFVILSYNFWPEWFLLTPPFSFCLLLRRVASAMPSTWLRVAGSRYNLKSIKKMGKVERRRVFRSHKAKMYVVKAFVNQKLAALKKGCRGEESLQRAFARMSSPASRSARCCT